MPTSISLLIAHPKELIRAGLRVMLAKSGIKSVGEAADVPSTLTLAKKHKPAVMILDAAIPGGDAFELARKLTTTQPGIQFVLLSALDNPTYMARAKAAGASNFLLESVGPRELITAVQNAAAGKPASGAGPFAKVTASLAARDTRATRDAGVTPREEQVLRHIAFGLSNDEIARSLQISSETAKEHVENILRKLGVNDRTKAAVWAVKSKLV